MPVDQLLQDLMASRQECAHWSSARWIPLKGAETLGAYEDWLRQGYHGEMEYLARHLELKADPTRLLPEAASVILVTKSYVPPRSPHGVFPTLRLAAYARGRDYHEEFGDELRALAAHLKTLFPDAGFRAGTDSLPVLERDFARQAGLGWIGKNTCLIDRGRGSFFFLGAILSTLPVRTEVAPVPDFCGTCTRCLEACPTGALESPRNLNATKCISYWTIEAKADPPPELSARFGDWFFGCDLCQSVCPWNQKPLRGESVLDASPVRDITRTDPTATQELREILTLDDTALRARVKPTPLSRAKPRGLRRNAMTVIANAGLTELRPEVERWIDDPELGNSAREALNRLDRSD